MTRPLAVRGRVHARKDPPFDRLFDLAVQDAVAGGPIARERLGARWADREGLAALTETRRPLATSLARALADYHRRLGAPAASLAALDRLAAGQAVCAIAGQQPAPLGGPLYGLHKTASAVGIARRIETRLGVPCVPVFWNHTEDSDFAEIRSATLADPALVLQDLSLPESAHQEGQLVGSIRLEPVAELGREALERWEGLPARATVASVWSHGLERARDLGELEAALLLSIFGELGLVVVDPRLPEFRAEAQGVVSRYLERADAFSAAARRAGKALEASLGRRPLSDAALESLVFAVEGGRRHKISVDQARARELEGALIPSVALRPAVQDAVLPTVAMACGPGELAYLAQLKEVFGLLEVRPACPVPRLGATWIPPAGVALLEESGADPWELVAATDQVLRRHAESQVPGKLREELDRLRDEVDTRLRRFAGSATALDPSLPQLVESARGKMDYQVNRLREGLAGKTRHRLERERPEWLRLRYYLSPGDRLQERRLALLEPLAYRGAALANEVSDLAELHAEALERGEHPHYLLEL